MRKSKPLLIVSGFLGTGKTTLLRRLLTALDGYGLKADVILNDFVNADIDTATLQISSATTISPIAAGCACCESLEELISLCEAASQGTGDLLIIELNGTADPLAILESFTLIENQLPFFPRLQVCVIDARHWGSREEFTLLEQRQMQSAGFWIPTYTDQVIDSDLTTLRNSLRNFTPNSIETNALNLVQTLVAEINRSHATSRSKSLSQELPLTPDQQSDTRAAMPHRHDAPHRLSHRFTGLEFRLPLKVRTVAMNRLFRRLPDWVLRAKALVKLVEEPGCRWLFEKVGPKISPRPLPVHSIRKSSSSMVCIGPRLDKQAIQHLVEIEFGRRNTIPVK